MSMKSIFHLILVSAILHSLGVCHSYAQNGPGGANTADLVLWLGADFEGLGNNVPAAQVSDRSGKGNDVFSYSGSYSPLNLTNQLNGRPVFSFDGANDQLKIIGGVSEMNGANEMSYFVVGQASAAVARGSFLCLKSSHKGSAFRFFKNNSTFYKNTLTATGVTATTSAYSAGFQIHSGIWDGGASDFNTYENHSLTGTKSNANGAFVTCNFLTIGRYAHTNGGFLNGEIAEVILFNSAINTTQRILIDNYLSSKYNLSLSSNDKFLFDGTYSFDVTGIGQETSLDNHTDSRGRGIVRVNSASDLEDGEYMLWGHDNGGTSTTLLEVPGAYASTSGEKLVQEWQVDISGGDNSVGTVTLTFNLPPGSNFGSSDDTYNVLIDDDGDFSNAQVINIIPSVTDDTVIVFTGVTLSDGDFFTLGNSNDIPTCASLTSGLWNLVFWDCAKIPDSTNHVSILSGTNVQIPANSSHSSSDLDIEGTLQLNDNSTLIVKGDLNIDLGASLIMGNNSNLILRGSLGSQSITNLSGDTIAFENVEIDNLNNVILSSGVFTLSDGLTLTNGNLTVNGDLKFLSSISKTAHINTIPNASIVNGTGTISVDRFRSTRNTNWGNITSSGVYTDLEDLNGEVFMSGIVGGNGYAAGSNGGGFKSVWAYNNITDQYESPPNTAQPFTIGRGFEIYLGSNINTWNGQAWNLEGDLHLDDISLDMNSAGGGWNLFGNPYLGFLDWDQITSDFGNISNNEFWYVDANLGAFVNVTTGGTTIPPGQGFWILATSDADLDLDPSIHLASGVSDPTFFKQNKINEQLMIHILHENEPYGATAFLRNEPSAFTGLDNFDITPLRFRDTAACHLSIETGETDVMVNYISDYEPEVTLPIRIDAGTEGKYVVKFNGTETFKKYDCISITDEQTGESFDVTNETSFTINVDDKKVAQYLTLRLSNEEVVDCQPNNASEATYLSNVWVNDGVINVDFHLDQPVGCEINIYNLVGDQIYSNSVTADYNRETIQMNEVSAGVYIVELNMNGLTETHKIIFN